MRKAKTDAEPLPGEIDGLTGRPEADNLVGIFAALGDETKADVLRRFGGGQFSAFKTALAELTVEKLKPIREEMRRLSADPAYVDCVLADGANKARAIARPNMDAVKDILGLVRGAAPLTPTNDKDASSAYIVVRRIAILLDVALLRTRPAFVMVNDFRRNFS